MTEGTECMNISIIVPMYHGEKYVNSILEQVKRNAENAPDVRLELLLYNDCPEETVTVNETIYNFDVRIINAKKNAGIHGARVSALRQAAGEYILFLDQDDVIKDHYIVSQYSRIGSADAVVCRLINGKRLHYTNSFRFEEVITRDFMLNHWCPIVSPGQVLLKKEAVPDIWKENILKNNGADDYFLWLCMMAAEKCFVLNQEVLFKHVITGFSVSEDTNLMMDSEEEMIGILERERVFLGYDPQRFDDLKRSLRRIHVKQLDRQRKGLLCLDQINRSIRKRGAMYDWIESRKGKKIAVYGAGELGLALRELLEEQGLAVSCYLDRNAEYILSEPAAYTMEDANAELDSILLTVSDQELERKLKQKFACEVMNMETISYTCGKI